MGHCSIYCEFYLELGCSQAYKPSRICSAVSCNVLDLDRLQLQSLIYTLRGKSCHLYQLCSIHVILFLCMCVYILSAFFTSVINFALISGAFAVLVCVENCSEAAFSQSSL